MASAPAENLWHQIRWWSTCSYAPRSMDSEFQITVLCWHCYMGNKKRLLNISRHSERYTQGADILCCPFTGCGTTNYFKWWNIWRSYRVFHVYSSLGKIRGQLGNARRLDGWTGGFQACLIWESKNHECEWAALHVIDTFVWLYYFYTRGFKKHWLCNPTSMPDYSSNRSIV